MKRLTIREVAARLDKKVGWLRAWLHEHPADQHGQPFWAQAGRTMLFNNDDLLRLSIEIVRTECGPRPHSDGDGYIYFIASGEFVKIGFSRAIDARMYKMRTDAPDGLELLHIEPGTFKQEKVFHRHFQALRVRGEWFKKAPELFAFIEQRRAIHRK